MTASVSIPRRVASLFLAFLTLLTLNANLLTVSASATQTKSAKIVWRSGYGVNARSTDFLINGKFWSKRKITIVDDFQMPNITSRIKDYPKEAAYVHNNARFCVTVKDKKGRLIASYSGLQFGSVFYLPKWSTKEYTITVSGNLNSYNWYNTLQYEAAGFGQYYLNY